MFGMLSLLKSQMQLVRGGLVALAVVMLAPGALVGLAVLSLILAPVAVFAIPFMLVVFFDSALAERHEEKVRSLAPMFAPAMAH